MPDALYDLPRLLEELEKRGVRFVLIGGLAMVAHGSAHVTADMDIAYSRDDANVAALAEALKPLKPTLRGAPSDLPFRIDQRTLKAGLNFTFCSAAGDLDVLGETEGVAFEDLWQRASIMSLYGREVRVASLPDLITMKTRANRAKDQNHLLELEEMLRRSVARA